MAKICLCLSQNIGEAGEYPGYPQKSNKAWFAIVIRLLTLDVSRSPPYACRSTDRKIV